MSASTTLSTGLQPGTSAGITACSIVSRLAALLTGEADANDRNASFARASVNRLNAEGVLAACAPEDDGGLGVSSLYDLATLTCQLARADASVAIAAGMHLTLSWYYARTVRNTPPDEREHLRMRGWLRAIGKREMIVCSSVAEPGRTPWSLATTATRTESGWLVNGRKVLASISPAATHFYSRVRVDSDEGPMQASAMIPMDVPGVRVNDDWDGLGLRGSGSGTVVFDNAPVPFEALSMRGRWGRPNPWHEGRAAQSAPTLAVYLGIAEAAHAHGLRAGGGPGRERTASAGARAAIAEMELAITAARGALHTVLVDLDRHVTDTSPRSVDSGTGLVLLKECVAAGMVVERAAIRIVDLAMQLCGGRSYVTGHPLGRLYRDVRAAAFMRPWAPAEEWLDFLASVAVGRLGDVAPEHAVAEAPAGVR